MRSCFDVCRIQVGQQVSGHGLSRRTSCFVCRLHVGQFFARGQHVSRVLPCLPDSSRARFFARPSAVESSSMSAGFKSGRRFLRASAALPRVLPCLPDSSRARFFARGQHVSTRSSVTSAGATAHPSRATGKIARSLSPVTDLWTAHHSVQLRRRRPQVLGQLFELPTRLDRPCSTGPGVFFFFLPETTRGPPRASPAWRSRGRPTAQTKTD
jgi:hypothetical protein